MVSGIVAGGLADGKTRERALSSSSSSISNQNLDIDSNSKTPDRTSLFLTHLLLDVPALSLVLDNLFGKGESLSDITNAIYFLFQHHTSVDKQKDNKLKIALSNTLHFGNEQIITYFKEQQRVHPLSPNQKICYTLYFAFMAKIVNIIFITPVYYLLYFLVATFAILSLLSITFLLPYLLLSQRARSYAYCTFLMWKHGTTYFGAALLMNWEKFFDTAAMYFEPKAK